MSSFNMNGEGESSSSLSTNSSQFRLPMSKIKTLMKIGDSEVCATSTEAAFVLSKSTEMFIGNFQ
jgi:hypothetical protein